MSSILGKGTEGAFRESRQKGKIVMCIMHILRAAKIRERRINITIHSVMSVGRAMFYIFER